MLTGDRLIGFSEGSQTEQRSAIVVGGTHAVTGRNQIGNVLFLKDARAGGLFAFYCGSKKTKLDFSLFVKKKRVMRAHATLLLLLSVHYWCTKNVRKNTIRFICNMSKAPAGSVYATRSAFVSNVLRTSRKREAVALALDEYTCVIFRPRTTRTV